ncbi:exodeoxyribonuclease 7 small subunit [Abditibacteriota bacterium]|nr:exodeoxyribonuclease 7 small subunit [Abditibacteriota bacterium]
MPSKSSTRRPESPPSPATAATPAEVPAASLSFEEALREYEEVVAKLETGGVPLEVSLALWKRGEELKGRCEQVLREAELTLQTLLLTDEGELELEESE